MADRPILFSGPMVRALLDGRKTQTRRVLKPQPDPDEPIAGADFVVMEGDPGRWCWLNGFDGSIVAPFNAPARPGDRLWVREAWRADKVFDDLRPSLIPRAEKVWPEDDRDNCDRHGRYRHARFMPRWASRLTLIVTDVRVERVRDISEEDASAEGCPGWYSPAHPDHGTTDGMTPRDEFRTLWDSINGKRDGCAWSDNPWVVALTFDVHHQNIDALPAPSVDGGQS